MLAYYLTQKSNMASKMAADTSKWPQVRNYWLKFDDLDVYPHIFGCKEQLVPFWYPWVILGGFLAQYKTKTHLLISWLCSQIHDQCKKIVTFNYSIFSIVNKCFLKPYEYNSN